MAMGAEAVVLSAIVTRIQAFVEAREAADRKVVDLLTRFGSIRRTLIGLREHVDSSSQDALELTEREVARAMASIVKWEKKGSLAKYRDGSKYDRLMKEHDRNLGARIVDLTAAVAISNRRQMSTIMARLDDEVRQFDFDPADPPSERASLLGSGAFGRTHRVIDRALKETYAMKVVNFADARDNGVDVDSVRNEARVMHQLRHENIVSYNCCFETKEGAALHIVMEYVGGGHLGAQVGKPHDTSTLQSWICQLCGALAYMHSLRVLHRDVKPDNVLLTETLRTLKLADLGLSAMVSKTLARSRVGTPPYMGPQRALGLKYGSPEDMWPTGCILAELIIGARISSRCAPDQFFSLDDALIAAVVEESEEKNATLGGVVRGLLERSPKRRLSAVDAMVQLGGERPAYVPTLRLPGLSEEGDQDEAAIAELEEQHLLEAQIDAARRRARKIERERRAIEARVEREQALAEELRKTEAEQDRLGHLRRQELELRLRREQEAEARARKSAEDQRRAREAGDALARLVSEAEARRRDFEAAAEAERTLADEGQHIAEGTQEKDRPVSNDEAIALVKGHGTLEPIGGLTQLTIIHLSDCINLTGDLEPLSALTQLTALSLYNCTRLTGDLKPLAGLTLLSTLDLSGDVFNPMQFTGDLKPLSGLTRLTKLNLYKCKQLKGDMTPIGELKQLNELLLGGCEQLADDLEPIRGLKQLTALDLRLCPGLIGDLKPLGELTRLKKLDLRYCLGLKGDLEPLMGLELAQLNLGSCKQLTGLDAFKSLHPTCQVHGP